MSFFPHPRELKDAIPHSPLQGGLWSSLTPVGSRKFCPVRCPPNRLPNFFKFLQGYFDSLKCVTAFDYPLE